MLFSWRHNPLWLYFHSPVAGFSLLVFEVSWSHTTTLHSRWDSSGRVMSPSQRPLPDSTQHWQQTNIHAPGGIFFFLKFFLIIGLDPLINIPDWSKSPVIVQGPIICICDWFEPPLTVPGQVWGIPDWSESLKFMTKSSCQSSHSCDLWPLFFFPPSFKEIYTLLHLVVFCVSQWHCSCYAYWCAFLV